MPIGGNFRKVQSGDRLRIPAITWNNILDVVRSLQMNLAKIGAGQPTSSIDPRLTVYVRNSTGVDLIKNYNVLRIVDTVYNHADKPNDSNRQIALDGFTPNSSDNAIVITQGPVNQDKLERACISGVTLCRVLMNDSSHEWANPVNGETEYLESANTGQARILWHGFPSGDEWVGSGSGPPAGEELESGIEWAIVHLIGSNSQSSHGWCGDYYTFTSSGPISKFQEFRSMDGSFFRIVWTTVTEIPVGTWWIDAGITGYVGAPFPQFFPYDPYTVVRQNFQMFASLMQVMPDNTVGSPISGTAQGLLSAIEHIVLNGNHQYLGLGWGGSWPSSSLLAPGMPNTHCSGTVIRVTNEPIRIAWTISFRGVTVPDIEDKDQMGGIVTAAWIAYEPVDESCDPELFEQPEESGDNGESGDSSSGEESGSGMDSGPIDFCCSFGDEWPTTLEIEFERTEVFETGGGTDLTGLIVPLSFNGIQYTSGSVSGCESTFQININCSGSNIVISMSDEIGISSPSSIHCSLVDLGADPIAEIVVNLVSLTCGWPGDTQTYRLYIRIPA